MPDPERDTLEDHILASASRMAARVRRSARLGLAKRETLTGRNAQEYAEKDEDEDEDEDEN